MSKKKVTVKFSITVKGSMGGSFEMDSAAFEELKSKWEASGRRRHDETELAEELLHLAPLNYFDHLMVDEMEIEDLDSAALSPRADSAGGA